MDDELLDAQGFLPQIGDAMNKVPSYGSLPTRRSVSDDTSFPAANAIHSKESHLSNLKSLTRIVGILFMLVAGAPIGAATVGTDVTYTTDADFDQGTLVNVNHDAPNNNQLQLNTNSGAFPFIWVALSQRCTIAKINTDTGAILGEYRTVADSVGCYESSRTTVALDGSVWVGHRGPGGVTHVGLVELNQCIDRNGSGTIETSTSYGDVKAWPGVTSDVSVAEDECILHHADTNALGMYDSRHMSIDANNKLWVGDYSGGHQFVRINGSTAAVETPVRSFDCGGYGGLIDSAGVIWSANGSNFGLLRWDPNAPDAAGVNPRCLPIYNYGLAVDNTGNIFVTDLGSNLYKVSPDGNTIQGPASHGSSSAQGLAVDGNGDVWVSSSLFCGVGCTVGHLKNDLTFVGNVPNPTGAGSTGVSVDAAGKIWTANLNSNTATRIDPTLGPIGADLVTPVGEVDLTVDFPAGPGGQLLPYPYNYSDMTGSQLLGTVPQGTWTVTQDGGAPGTAWTTITWNNEPQGSEPAGTSITVEARAADTEAGLGGESYVPVGNGVAFALTGQFIQVRVTLKPSDAGDSPVLSDIRIQSEATDTTPPVAGCTETVNAGGKNVPKSGANAGESGQNPDGFYELSAADDVDGAEGIQLFLRDTGTGVVFGPFEVGTKVKYVQANGAAPSQKPGPGVIDWQINGQGDAEVLAVDASGNVADPVACRVPAPPK